MTPLAWAAGAEWTRLRPRLSRSPPHRPHPKLGSTPTELTYRVSRLGILTQKKIISKERHSMEGKHCQFLSGIHFTVFATFHHAPLRWSNVAKIQFCTLCCFYLMKRNRNQKVKVILFFFLSLIPCLLLLETSSRQDPLGKFPFWEVFMKLRETN